MKNSSKNILPKHKIVLNKMTGNNRSGMNLKQAQIDAGYSENYADSGRIKNTISWQELMEQQLPDETLLKVHKEGLNAMRREYKIVDRDDRGNPIYDFIEVEDYAVRHRYLDSGYKLKKRYEESIRIHRQFSHLTDEELDKEVAEIIAEAIEGVLESENDK